MVPHTSDVNVGDFPTQHLRHIKNTNNPYNFHFIEIPMDPLKEAFRKVKEEISFLKSEIEDLKQALSLKPTQQSNQQTNQHITPAKSPIPTHIPTHNYPLEALKSQISEVSTGSDGVPTNQPTNQPTIFTGEHIHVNRSNPHLRRPESQTGRHRARF